MQDSPKFTHIGIFGLKTCHQATLTGSRTVGKRDRIQQILINVHNSVIERISNVGASFYIQ
jgi:hypothetical protein